MVTSGPMRGAHRARCNRPGSAGVPPTSRLRGRDARAPSLCSPLPSMRLAPHPDGMNILPGRTSPSQTLPPGGEMGKPGFPIPLRGGVWGNRVSPHPAPRGLCSRFLGGLRPPKPSQEKCEHLPLLAHSAACLSTFVPDTCVCYNTISRPCGCAAPQPDAKRLFLEGLRPPIPSHSVRGWGNQVSPSPCSRAAPAQILPRAGMQEPLLPELHRTGHGTRERTGDPAPASGRT